LDDGGDEEEEGWDKDSKADILDWRVVEGIRAAL